jgi:hypothetical protein
MVAHTSNTSTEEAEAGGSQVQAQPGLYSETLPQNEKKNPLFLESLISFFPE